LNTKEIEQLKKSLFLYYSKMHEKAHMIRVYKQEKLNKIENEGEREREREREREVEEENLNSKLEIKLRKWLNTLNIERKVLFAFKLPTKERT
jgi:hypothetical protein